MSFEDAVLVGSTLPRVFVPVALADFVLLAEVLPLLLPLLLQVRTAYRQPGASPMKRTKMKTKMTMKSRDAASRW